MEKISKEEQARRDEIAKLPHIVLGQTADGIVAKMPVFPGPNPPGSLGEMIDSGDMKAVNEFLGKLGEVIPRAADEIIAEWKVLRGTAH